MQAEKSQSEGKRIMPGREYTDNAGNEVNRGDTKVVILRSASETDV